MQGYRSVVESAESDEDQVSVKIEGYDAAIYVDGEAVIQVTSCDKYEDGVTAYLTLREVKKLRKALKLAEKFLEA